MITEATLYSPFMHVLLMQASEGNPRMAIERANYLSAYQCSLDLNLPGPEREEFDRLRKKALWALAFAVTDPQR